MFVGGFILSAVKVVRFAILPKDPGPCQETMHPNRPFQELPLGPKRLRCMTKWSVQTGCLQGRCEDISTFRMVRNWSSYEDCVLI